MADAVVEAVVLVHTAQRVTAVLPALRCNKT